MEWVYRNGIGSIVIASGEFNNEGRTEFIEGICDNTIKKSIQIDQELKVYHFPPFHFIAIQSRRSYSDRFTNG